LGNQNYSQSELLAVLNTPSNSDASLMILARQLIAAKLNIFNSSNPAPAASAIADADGLLTGFTGKMSYGVKTTSAIGTNIVRRCEHARQLRRRVPHARLHAVRRAVNK
jgi:hypothetical protein